MVMDYSDFILKKVFDKEGKRIGKVTRIDSIHGEEEEKKTFYAIIRVPRFLRKDLLFPLPVNKTEQIRLENNHIILDVKKNDFLNKAEKYEAAKNQDME
jgi:sporulation protein YlmC with PRC-barrel domain